MRIVSGTHKGRIITAPKNLPVRPTTDFAKEAMFNILMNHFDFSDIKVLDLFSGTGNISYEFASRGSEDVTAVDSHYNCHAFIKKTALEMGFKIKAIKSDVFPFLKHSSETYDIIFADPPFEFEEHHEIAKLVFEKDMLKEGGWLIIEHSDKTSLAKQEYFLEKRYYGKVNFSIFGKQ